MRRGGGAARAPPRRKGRVVTVSSGFWLEVLLYWRLATALAGQTRCAWRRSERAELYHVLHLRDLSEKKEGFHVVRHAMAAACAREEPPTYGT